MEAATHTEQECEKHGPTYMNGRGTCGRCYMQRAADLGMVKAPRKGTKFHYCAAHVDWFAGETRRRQAEVFAEGGWASAPACSGDDRCEMKPGTDFFVREFVEDNPVVHLP